MGTVMAYGRSGDDVTRWPPDAAARQALEKYLRGLPTDSLNIIVPLGAGKLDFTGADLSGLELSDAELIEAMLPGVRLVGADLASAWLIGTVLRDADLSRCNLRKAQARACDARGAVFRGANLQRAEFDDANLRGADLSQTRLSGAALLGTDLRDADLRECSFGQAGRSTDLDEARLAGCRVDGATGLVAGTADVGTDTSRPLHGADLQRWFAEHGAPDVEARD